MIVYSFFLKWDSHKNTDEFDFMIEHSHCLKPKYQGFHPVIRESDGSFKILYAMTTSKKIRNLFTITRNMNLFEYYKSEISNKKYIEIKEKLNDIILVEKSLIDVENGKPVSINTVLTNYEFEKVTDDLFTTINGLNDIFDSNPSLLIEKDIFHKKVSKAFGAFNLLESLEMMYYTGSNDCDFEYYSNEFYRIFNKLRKNTIIKSFEVFIELFGNTLKE